jgi:hypothetical protein
MDASVVRNGFRTASVCKKATRYAYIIGHKGLHKIDRSHSDLLYHNILFYCRNRHWSPRHTQAVSRWLPTTGLVMWDLWWTKWRWGRFFSEYFDFPSQSLFHKFLHNHHHLSSGAGTIGQYWLQYPKSHSTNKKKTDAETPTYHGYYVGHHPVAGIYVIQSFGKWIRPGH